MKLDVLHQQQEQAAWYEGGLKFTCSQCGNCCTGGPGYIWVSPEEIRRVAAFLELSPEEVVEKYCRKIDGRFSFKERRTAEGLYDCIFLREQAQPSGGDNVPLRRKSCSIYSVRPLQCRTWPFWPENLASPKNWDRAAKRCHGMNGGRRVFSRQQIETIRDASDWPDHPPTSEDAPNR